MFHWGLRRWLISVALGCLKQEKEDLLDRAGGWPSLQAAAAAATWSDPAGCRPQHGPQERGSWLPAQALADLRGGQCPTESRRVSRSGRICLPAARQARPRRAHTHARTRAHIHTHTHPHTCGRQGPAARSLNISVRARRSPGRRSALPAALRASCQPPDLLASSLLAGGSEFRSATPHPSLTH